MTMNATPRNHRKLRFHILRYNPAKADDTPRVQVYELEEAPGMTLFIALTEIREKLDPSLQFDFVCRAGICGSCGMMINGRPTPTSCCSRTPERRRDCCRYPRSRRY